MDLSAMRAKVEGGMYASWNELLVGCYCLVVWSAVWGSYNTASMEGC